MSATLRELLHTGHHGEPRVGFLRRVSSTLLAATGADLLDLWLERGDLRYRWRAEGGPAPTPAERFARIENSDRAAPLLDEVLLELGASGAALDRAAVMDGGVRCLGAADATSVPAAQADPGPWDMTQPSWVLLPFSIDETNRGVLRLASREPGFFDRARTRAMSPLSWALGSAIASRRAHGALAERVKELTCMYAISELSREADVPLRRKLERVVDLLPPAWQYPELATARLVVDGDEILSRGFATGPHRLAAAVVVRGRPRGRVEVFYVDRGSKWGLELLVDRPFLQEEENLITAVSRAIASLIENDVIERERTELREQVRHAERLATIGQLAAGVAHELNEPLGNILGFAQLAAKSAEIGPQPRRDLQKIVAAALHAREIITKLLFFARQQPPRRVPVDLNGIVREVTTVMAPRCRLQGIHAEADLTAEALAEVDPAQMQQVLVNLVVNAIQAMPEGGFLRVRTAVQGNQVELTVADTGVGMSADVRDKIFVPFFTTKDVGEGTGLGLSVVHGIVQAHAGRIDVESEVGRGTTFTIRLPAQPAAGASIS